jgi:hypothetical protein
MEPLSITASVVTIATRVIPAAVQVYNVWTDYSEAPQSVADIIEELQIIKTSLHQLQKILGREDAKVTLDLEDGDVFALAVNGCKATLLCIEEEYKNVVGCGDWFSRIKVLWKDGTMTRLVEQLARRKTSIVLLMQCLNLYARKVASSSRLTGIARARSTSAERFISIELSSWMPDQTYPSSLYRIPGSPPPSLKRLIARR